MPSVPRSFRMPVHQQGSVLVQFALLLGVLVTLLGVVQIGLVYHARRDLQRIADVAAIEAANALSHGDPASCATGQAAGAQSIAAQMHWYYNDPSHTVECGHWDATLIDALRFNPAYGLPPAPPLNAARVTVRGETLRLLPFTPKTVVAATATATKVSEPVASFQVGAQLLRFNDSALLGRVLTGVGLDVERLTVLDKDGVANARITPAGLLEFLGLPVGVDDLALVRPEDLANVTASLLDLIDASIAAAGRSALNAGVDLGALQALRAELAPLDIANVRVPLGGARGLLAVVGVGRDGTVGAGLDVALDVADLVRTQLLIAHGDHAVALDLGIPGLVAARLTVTEPPTVAIGPPDGSTRARSAQVRLGLDIGGSHEGPVGLLDLLGVNLHVPIRLDLVRSTATLEAVQCTAGERPRANISVRSAVADLCIGELDANGTCQPAELVDVNLLGLAGVVIRAGRSVSLLGSSSSVLSQPPDPQQCPHNPGDECLVDMEVGEDPVRLAGPNGLRLGSTVAGLLTTITGLVADISNATGQGLLGPVVQLVLALVGGLQGVLNLVVGVVTSLLTPILNALGSVLDVVLTGVLGTELGRAEVEILGIQCDTAQLVQ